MSNIKDLLPELRFPDFKSSTGWNTPLFRDVYTFKVTNSFSRDKLNYIVGEVKNIHYGDIHTKFATLFDIEKENVPFINIEEKISNIKDENYCEEGDMVFADASEDMDDIGKSIEIINLNNEKLLSGLHTLLARPKKKLAKGFAGYLFKSNSIRKQIKKEAQGAKVLGLSSTRLSNIKLTVPSDKKEQQKIANCLTSIDELIGTEGQKLDALKRHKKGLMQQLFPAEGQTRPALRFPEFESSRGWNPETIKSICSDIFSGGTPTSTESKYYGGDIPFIRSAEISKNYTELFLSYLGLSNSSAKMVEKGDVLVALYGANSGDVAISNIDGAINQAILCLKSIGNEQFIYQFLSHKKSWIVSTYIQGGQGNLSGEIVKSIKIYIPKNESEKQKISNILNTLDQIIDLQTEKVAILKDHKKGLMQQLFPSDNIGK